MTSITPSPGLFTALFGDANIAAEFSDAQYVRYLLHVEAALAKVQGRLGVIPAEAAGQITAGIGDLQADFDQLQAGMENDGFPMIELVRQIRAQVGGDAASYIHWGATTQDIMDTAAVLQMRAALDRIERGLQGLIAQLARLADRHRDTLMAGRTHSQQALPITFGLKVARWLAPLLRDRRRLAEIRTRLLVVQFGGAAGTLASLDGRGLEVQQALAEELQLGVPLLPWHTERDTLAEAAGWLALLSGSLAKMAQDVILMAQTEVDELRESADRSRGGSSTMPQKSNPVMSEVIIAAARTNAALLAAMHQALIQEHERATHGLQMEWLSLPQMFILTGGALNKALALSENLVVNADQMRRNVEASHGLMLAEALSFALAAHMERAKAKQIVRDAVEVVRREGRHLVDVAREMTSAPLDWEALRDERHYLGAAQAFIERVLRAAVEQVF